MNASRRRLGGLGLLLLCGGLVIAVVAILSAAQVGSDSMPAISTTFVLGMISRQCYYLDSIAQILDKAQYTYLTFLPSCIYIAFLFVTFSGLTTRYYAKQILS